MNFAQILEAMNKLQCWLAASESGTGEVVCRLLLKASRAGSEGIDLPFKRLTAALAKRWFQPGQVLITGIAKGPALSQGKVANRTNWRIKHIQQFGSQISPRHKIIMSANSG